MIDAIEAREEAYRGRTAARHNEYRYMASYGAGPYRLAVRANLHKQRRNASVIALPDLTSEGDPLMMLPLLARCAP